MELEGLSIASFKGLEGKAVLVYRVLFEVSIDWRVVEKVKRFIENNRMMIVGVTPELPEVKYSQALLDKGLPLRELVRYIVFVSANDWRLSRLKGGAETLWRLASEEFREGASFREIALAIARRIGARSALGRRLVVVGEALDRLHVELSKVIAELEESNVINVDAMRGLVHRLALLVRELSRGNIRGLPGEKIASLASRTLFLVAKLRVKGKISIMYDIHVAKVSVRLGIVRVEPRNADLIAVSLFNRTLRKRIVEAWLRVAEEAKLSPWHLDAFLWVVGRQHCLFDDKVGSLDISRPCPEARKNGATRCPLSSFCLSALGKVSVAVFSSRTTGGEEVAVVVNSSRFGSGLDRVRGR